MEFENSFSVNAPLDRVWEYLLDVQAVAPCVPGASLTEAVSESEYKGTVKIKLGAVQVSYRGTLVLNEVDQESHTVIMTATGSETRGTGGASGKVTSVVSSEGPNKTTVHMVSEVNVTGRVAQFGRNIMQDVSNRLIREFAKCLEANLNAREEEIATGTASPAQAEGSQADTTAAESPEVPDSVRIPATDEGTRVGDVGPTVPSAEPATRESVRPEAPQVQAAELKVLPLVLDITRSKVAGGLRRIAAFIDPDA